MIIRYLGHSCFVLTSDAGTSVLTDPYEEIGFRMPAVRADAVTVSHRHFDHDNTAAVEGSPVLLERAGEYTVGDIAISAVESFHDDAGGKKRGKNLIFKFRIDGWNVCHLGDLGEALTESRVKSVLPADILMIPVGGVFTIDAETARAYTAKICPAAVIPMHFMERGLNFMLGSADAFLKGYPQERILKAGHSWSPSPALKSEGTMKIVFMKRGE